MKIPGIGILSSLLLTLKHLFRKKLTLRYPKEKQPMDSRFFGLMRLTKDDEGNLKCTACGICARNCPVHAIDIVKGKRENNKPFPQQYNVKIQQCMFCGICVEVCPFDALHVGNYYELASFSREGLLYNKEDIANQTGGSM